MNELFLTDKIAILLTFEYSESAIQELRLYWLNAAGRNSSRAADESVVI
jgi:hypothetical protein